MGGVKPEEWDPKKPTPKICIWCYGPAAQIAVWKYGTSWTCFMGNCIKFTKKMVGFAGLYESQTQADGAYSIILREREAKMTKGTKTGTSKRKSKKSPKEHA